RRGGLAVEDDCEASLVVIVLVPIAFLMPATLVFLPPPMLLTPATLPRIAIHDARDLPVCCGVRVCQLLRGVHVLRERLGADIDRGLLPEGAALWRKVEPLRE